MRVPFVQQSSNPSLCKNVPKLYNIALLTNGFNYVTAQIKDGFIQTLHSSHQTASYSFKLFDSEGKNNSLYAHMRDIVNDNYDLIFSIGNASTKAALDITALNNKPIPIIFCSVDKPVEQGLIESLLNSGNHLTGIASHRANYQEQILTLLKIKPSIKTIFIAYDPSNENSRNQMLAAKKSFQDRLMKVSEIPILHQSDIIKNIQPQLAFTDVLFTLQDDISRQNMPLFAKLCGYFGVTLVTSDIESVHYGAAIGFGQPSREIGIQAAQKALLITQKKLPAYSIPTTHLEAPFKIFLNRDAIKLQNIDLDPHLLSLMNSSELV